MVGFGLATPGNLLLFTFLIGCGRLDVPAWQAVVPLLVPKNDISGAFSKTPPRKGAWSKRSSSNRRWEHLRQHERVTNADRIVQDAVARFHLHGEPKVTHFIAAESG